MHAYAHTYTHTHTNTYTDTQTHTDTHTQTHIYTHSHINTHRLNHTNTHTHTHTVTQTDCHTTHYVTVLHFRTIPQSCDTGVAVRSEIWASSHKDVEGCRNYFHIVYIPTCPTRLSSQVFVKRHGGNNVTE